MWQRNLSQEIESRVLKIMLSMPMNHAKNGKSPQQVQTEDTIAVNIDVKKTTHPI